MKKYFFYLAAFTALGVTSCRKIEVDGDGTGSGGGTVTPGRVELTGHVTKNTTLKKGDENILTGFVYVDAGVTLTVEKGATVKGSYTGTNTAALIVKRGAKLIAIGTQDDPIIFTSANPTPQSGDWGGIVLLGKADINGANTVAGSLHLYVPEGGFNNAAGDGLAGWGDAVAPAAVNDDNSGTLQYVRIQYAGYAFQPNQEINSLTMAAVGSGTTIDHIEVTYAKDDAYEWFGGTVNCKYLIAYRTQDDDFDTDLGYSGSVQFGLIVRDSSIADVSKSEAFESDNDGSGSTLTPKTSAVFSNVSAFGPLATLSNVGNSNYLGSAAQIRRNSTLSIFNSTIVGWAQGILIDASTGAPTDLNYTANTLKLSGIVIVGCRKAIGFSTGSNSNVTGKTEADIQALFAANTKNVVLSTAPEVTFTRPFNYGNPDWAPTGNSSLLLSATANTHFDDALLTARPFIKKVNFIGAIAASGEDASWHKGWTIFN